MSDSEIVDVFGDFAQRFDTKEEPFMRPRSVYQRDYVRALFWPSSLAIDLSNSVQYSRHELSVPWKTFKLPVQELNTLFTRQ